MHAHALRLVPLIVLGAVAPHAFAEAERRVAPYEPNPHYLAMDGVPVFPLGATHQHSWTPISRPDEFDLLRDLDRLAAVTERIGSPHVRGFVRCLPYDPMNQLHDGEVPRRLQPWKRTEDGRHDLEAFEPEWEQRLIQFLDAARERGIVVALEVWDDWSVTRGPGGAWDPAPPYAWHGHPFNPDNNINYGSDALPNTTSGCDAPFYQTIAELEDNATVLRLQHHYVDHLVELAGDYPNVIWNLSNESRASLGWSRYWAEHLREVLPGGAMIGDMPSTNRRDGGGECDDALSPLTLATDERYGFVDIAQGVSGHEFPGDLTGQVIGARERIRQYRAAMAEAGRIKPLIVSKDYQRGPDGGTAVVWSRFVGGAAAARFHRPSADDRGVDDFQYEAIERLGRLIARTEFWTMRPLPALIADLPGDTPGANVLGRPGHEHVIQFIGGEPGALTLRLEPGEWRILIYEPKHDKDHEPGGEDGHTLDATDDSPLRIDIPDYDETLILHLRRNRAG